ncbi:hypothetical protein GCM10017579_37940 [Nocardioides luteus]|uniref:Uncharacterized protein n=1 Tax=Nocardioides luteus TaxID=1844 RepID=A0ABQ5T1R0_9ACTN|nr:hypothetical protein GCM10017579_37940 [Nocardioides luteus]
MSTGGRACRDLPAGNDHRSRLWAADPFVRVFSICPGVKDGLRPPATPAASRSWTPEQVEKKTWLAIGAAARVWRGEIAPPVVELVETTKPTTTIPFTEEKVAYRATYHPQIRS